MVEHYGTLLAINQDTQKHPEAFAKMNQVAHQSLESLYRTVIGLLPP